MIRYLLFAMIKYLLFAIYIRIVVQVRNTAIQAIREIYDNPKLTLLIDEFCKSMINNLLQPAPSHTMFPALPRHTFGRFIASQSNVTSSLGQEWHLMFVADAGTQWTEGVIKNTLYLYLSLIPDQPSYIDL